MAPSLQPKTKQARDQILDWIRGGRFVPGDRLPSERQLAVELEMNHLTVRGGLSMLSKEGLIDKQPRSGNFVKEIRSSELVKQIAMVLPKWLFDGASEHPTIGMLLRGISRELNQNDYSLTHMIYGSGQLWLDVGQTMVRRGIKGMLLWPHVAVSRDDIFQIQQNNIKVVTMMAPLSSQLLGLGLVDVRMDLGTALVQMMDRLVAMGHRRIVVTLYEDGAQRQYETELLANLCKHLNLGPVESVKVDIPMNEAQETDFSVIERILDRDPLPTAVILYDEFLVSCFFYYCYQRNIRIPEQISVLALNNNLPNASPVALTTPDTVHLISEVGRLAARYLARLMNEETVLENEVKLRCDVQWNESATFPWDSVDR